jgi:hypothetical protein
MAILEQLETGRRCVLLARHLIGRSKNAHLRLDEPTISGEHATIRWNGTGWEILDLASRNGTKVDGRRLTPGERVTLRRDAIVGFGTQAQGWRLVDDGPPSAMAVPADGGAPLPAHDDFLALPGEDEPEVTVYRNRAGEWMVERSGSDAVRAVDGHEVVAGGRRFVLHLAEAVTVTWEGQSAPLDIHEARLCFAVSRDEEHVELTVVTDRRRIELGSRASFYLLLTLARARLEDAADEDKDEDASHGQGASDHGWVYQDDLAQMLGLDLRHLNVVVYRCRQQLAAAGIMNAADVIERRNATRQMRLGVGRIEVTTI